MTQEEVFTTVKANIMEVLPDIPAADITIDKRLKDLGANSVDRMEVVTLSMEDLGLKIPLVEFAGITNIESLVQFLHSRKNGS